MSLSSSLLSLVFCLFFVLVSINHTVDAYNCSALRSDPDYTDDDLGLSDEYDSWLSQLASQYEIDSYASEYGADASSMQKLLEKFLRQPEDYDAEYYLDLVRKAQILTCENSGAKEQRYAEIIDDPSKCQQNEAGNRTYAADWTTWMNENNKAVEGRCEGPSNCYWKDITDTSEDRPVKYTEAEVEEAKDFFMGHAKNTGLYGASLIALSLLWILIMIIVIILRCCCGCCGGRAKKEGYTCCQRWTPLIFYILFTIIGIASGVFAALGAIEVNTGVNQVFESASNGVIRVGRTIERLHGPLTRASNIVGGAVNETKNIADDMDWLVPGYNGIEKRIKKMRSLYGESEEMAFFVSSVNGTLETLQQDVKPIVDNMDTTVSAVSEGLVESSAMVLGLIEMGTELLEGFNTSVISLGETIESTNPTEGEYYIFIGNGLPLILFVISLLLICCGYCGIASGYTTCKWDDLLMIGMHCTWVFGTLIVFLAFFFSGLLMLFGLVWYDSCQILEYSTSNFTQVIGGEYGSAIDNAWNGSSLLEAFNMSSQLEFIDTLSANFDELDSMNVSSSFNTATAPLSKLDTTLRVFNGTTAMDFLNGLTDNDAAGCPYDDTFTFANINEPWLDQDSSASTTWGSTESYARSGTETAVGWFRRIYDAPACGTDTNYGIIRAYYTLANLTEIVNNIRADIGINSTYCSAAAVTCPTPEFQYDTSVNAHLVSYEANVTVLFEKVGNLTTNMVGDIVEEIGKVKCVDNIDFLKESYYEVHTALCETLLNGVLQTTVSFVALGIAMIGIVIVTLVLHGRLKVDSKAVIAEREFQEEIEELEEEGNDYYDQGDGYNVGNFQLTKRGGSEDEEYA